MFKSIRAIHAKNKKIIAAIFFFAFSIRICAVIIMPQEAPDSGGYLKLAKNIKNNHFFSYNSKTPADSRAPMYPFFIACIFTCFGEDNITSIRIIQALIDSITCLLIFFTALILWSNFHIAILCSVIAIIHPSLIASNLFILSETLSVFLLTASILFFLIALEKGQKVISLFSGILMGLCALTRPIILLMPFLLGITSKLTKNKNNKSNWIVTIFICSFICTVTPWTMRNFYHFKKLIPVSSNFGESLWAGNQFQWKGLYNPQIMNIRSEIGKKIGYTGTGYYKIDCAMKSDAIKIIKENPYKFILHSMLKLKHFWFRIPGQEEILKGKPILLYSITIFHYILITTALIGIIINIKNKCTYSLLPLACIIYFSFFHSILMALPRYRIPIIPFVILFHGSILNLKLKPLLKKLLR